MCSKFRSEFKLVIRRYAENDSAFANVVHCTEKQNFGILQNLYVRNNNFAHRRRNVFRPDNETKRGT